MRWACAFQKLKKAAENQQKTGLDRSSPVVMRPPEAFLAQALDFTPLPKFGVRHGSRVKYSGHGQNSKKYFLACRIKSTRGNTDWAI
jgi:hypothetical protein